MKYTEYSIHPTHLFRNVRFSILGRWLQTYAQNIEKHYANKYAGPENRPYSSNPDSAKGAAGTKWSIIGTLG
jgi:hypothetical protein